MPRKPRKTAAVVSAPEAAEVAPGLIVFPPPGVELVSDAVISDAARALSSEEPGAPDDIALPTLDTAFLPAEGYGPVRFVYADGSIPAQSDARVPRGEVWVSDPASGRIVAKWRLA